MSAPLDLTKPVRTRDGQPARIVATDRKQSGYPLLACIGQFEEMIVSYHADGTRAIVHGDNPYARNEGLDLINIPETVKLWAVIADERPGGVQYDGLTRLAYAYFYKDKPATTKNIGGIGRRVIACIPIEFKEGEGLG